MHWNSLSEFISMGGYGVFVWGSFAVTFLLLTAEVLMLCARNRRLAQTGNLRDEFETRN
jgi:heme exporter protein D